MEIGKCAQYALTPEECRQSKNWSGRGGKTEKYTRKKWGRKGKKRKYCRRKEWRWRRPFFREGGGGGGFFFGVFFLGFGRWVGRWGDMERKRGVTPLGDLVGLKRSGGDFGSGSGLSLSFEVPRQSERHARDFTLFSI